jgi:peroxiredoxin
MLLSAVAWAQESAEESAPPKVGEEAKNFKLLGLDEKPVELVKLAEEGPVVVVVLRGYPGYQCPICTKQVASYVQRAKDFVELKARVVLIYPGPADELRERALEFLEGAKLPEPFVMVTDPDYRFTTLYGLRWEAPRETAYPSTFVLDAERKVKFRKISKSHGDRAEVDDVLATLKGA